MKLKKDGTPDLRATKPQNSGRIKLEKIFSEKTIGVVIKFTIPVSKKTEFVKKVKQFAKSIL